MKHLKLYETFLNENRPSDLNKWVDAFINFLDTTWQEDTEIDIISQLSEYKDKFKSSPSSAWDYLQNWNKANKDALDRSLSMVSDTFSDRYANLVDGKISEGFYPGSGPDKLNFKLNSGKKSATNEFVKLYNGIKNDHSIQRYSMGWKDVIRALDKKFKAIAKTDDQFTNEILMDAIRAAASDMMLVKTLETFAKELDINMETLRKKK